MEALRRICEEDAKNPIPTVLPIAIAPAVDSRHNKVQYDPNEQLIKMTPEEIKVRNKALEGPFVHNCVATVYMGYKPDVHRIAWALRGKHNGKAFSAPVCMRISYPRSAILLFHSGKMVLTGTKSPEVAIIAVYKIAKFFRRKTGAPCQVTGFSICNMQATFYLGYQVDVYRMARTTATAMFRPRLFGALKFKMNGVTFLIWQSGSVVITGARNKERLEQAMQDLAPILAHYWVRDMSKTELLAEKKAHEVRTKFLSSMEKIRNKLQTTKTKLMSAERKKVTKFTIDTVDNLRDIVDVFTTPCPGPPKKTAKKRFFCQHEVSLKYNKDGEWIPVGKMERPLIEKLLRQNNLPVPEHFQSPAGVTPLPFKTMQQMLDPSYVQ